MIREICRCPDCRQACGLDDEVLDLVFELGAPCEHCAFLAAWLGAYEGERVVESRSCLLLWVRGEGLQRIRTSELPDSLCEYVQMLATNDIPGCPPLLSAEDLPVGVKYAVTGGTSTQREEAQPGSGEFLLAEGGGPALSADLDGWGLFSHNPDAAVAAIRECYSR
jgi:hypothetical protein